VKPGKTISVGIGATLSGPYAGIGAEMKQAAELAIEEANDTGGIGGARLSAQAADDRSSAETAEVVAHQFCASNDLLGVIGHYSSDTSIAASKIYYQCGLAMISPIASNPALTDRGYGNTFRFTNRDDCTGRAIAGYLYRSFGKRRAVVIQSEYAYGKSMTNAFTDAFQRSGGQILVRENLTVGEREFGPLASVLPNDFDVLFYGGAFEGAPLLKAMREAGKTQLFAAGDGCWDITNFLEPAGDAATAGEGVLVLSATPAIGQVAGSQAFAERYRQRHGPITNYAVNSYDTARLLIQAIGHAAEAKHALPSRTEVIEAIRSIRFQGIAYRRPVEWDAKGDNTAAITALYVINGKRFRQIAEIESDGGELKINE
jgi:branched-chain amino acid transport system substrate-binding protein